jgi:hypothetical protein
VPSEHLDARRFVVEAAVVATRFQSATEMGSRLNATSHLSGRNLSFISFCKKETGQTGPRTWRKEGTGDQAGQLDQYQRETDVSNSGDASARSNSTLSTYVGNSFLRCRQRPSLPSAVAEVRRFHSAHR